LRKLTKRFKLVELLLLRLVPIYATATVGTIYGVYATYSYIANDYEYSIAINLMWFIFITFSAWGMATMNSLTYGLVYITSYYLKLRFEQVADCLPFVSQRSVGLLYKIMQDHDQVTRMTDQYNQFLKDVMIVNYFAATILFNLFVYIGFFGSGNTYFRSLVASQICYAFFAIYISTYTSANVSGQVNQI